MPNIYMVPVKVAIDLSVIADSEEEALEKLRGTRWRKVIRDLCEDISQENFTLEGMDRAYLTVENIDG